MVSRVGQSAAARRGLSFWPTMAEAGAIVARAPVFFLGLSLVSDTPSLVAALIAAGNRSDRQHVLLALAFTYLLLFFTITPITAVAARLASGEPWQLRAVLGQGAARYLVTAAVTLVLVIGFYAGLLLIVAPGLFFLAVYAIAQPAVVLERRGPFAAMRRSAVLTRRRRWRVLGTIGAVVLAYFIATYVISFIAIRTGHRLTGSLLASALRIVEFPFATIVTTLVFLALRDDGSSEAVADVFE